MEIFCEGGEDWLIIFNMEPKILFENDDVLVLNKPAGMLVHGMAKGKSPVRTEIHPGGQIANSKLQMAKRGLQIANCEEETLVDWLIKKYPSIKDVGDHNLEAGEYAQTAFNRPGIVHRLDRETSGVLVVAKNQKAFLFLKNLFQTGAIKKTYLALVWGDFREKTGMIDKPISIRNGSVKRTVASGKMTREAITEYRVVEQFIYNGEPLALLKVFPKTGRTHQIRVHLNSIGHSVLGDKLYGKRENILGLTRHFLHAEEIELPLPDGSRVLIAADLPAELLAELEKVRGERAE